MTKENLEINLNELAKTKTLFVINEEQVKTVIDIALELKTKEGAPILAVLNNLLKINAAEAAPEVEGEIVE